MIEAEASDIDASLLLPLLPATSSPLIYSSRSTRLSPSLVSDAVSHVRAQNNFILNIDNSEIQGQVSTTTIPYDYLVYAVGAEVQTFNIPGVKENACFMKELHDAENVRSCHHHAHAAYLDLVSTDATAIYGLR